MRQRTDGHNKCTSSNTATLASHPIQWKRHYPFCCDGRNVFVISFSVSSQVFICCFASSHFLRCGGKLVVHVVHSPELSLVEVLDDFADNSNNDILENMFRETIASCILPLSRCILRHEDKQLASEDLE
ncbi:hypothetical protein V5799_011376 [Amblyomma americanum]|uniref:Uncharacterized protein n=1 Tax=Amblyomma americanum TaxID=6943 RepID=A0AAQ4EHD5_AMBAM